MLQGHLEVDDPWNLPDLALQGRRVFLEQADVLPAHGHGERLLPGEPAHLHDRRENPGDRAQPFPHLLLYLVLAPFPLPLFGELHVHHAVPDRPRVPGPDGREGAADLAKLAELRKDRLDAVPRLDEGCIRRRLEIDLELGPVHRREELGLEGREREEAAEERQRREGKHRLPMPEGPRDHRPIPVGRPVEPSVEPVEDPGDEMPLPRPVDVGVVPARREHRVEGERHEEGNEHREGHGDPELEEEAPDDPLHERHRHEDGDDGEGRGEHREPDLRGPGPGRLEMVLPVLEVPDDVLPDHDRVVDEEADGEGQRHQRHDVERHSHEVHDDEGGDDGDRQGESGDHRGAPRVEEAEDDEDRQDPAEDQGRLDVVHGVPDHDRGVPDDLDPRTRGKLRLQARDLLLHQLDHGDRVRPRLLLDVERDRGHAVHQREGPRLLDPVDHVGHLAQQHGPPVPLADHHRREPGHFRGLPRNAQREFGPVPRQPAERGVDVFGPDPRDHLVHAHPERLEARLVDVDVDLAFGGTDEVDLPHAGDVLEAPLDLFLHQGREVPRRGGCRTGPPGRRSAPPRSPASG